MKRQLLLAALALLPLAAAAAAPSLPNIIIIYGDDIGYGDFGCYGGTGAQTPNVDTLAAGGLRFTSGYCSAATCTPSRYSLLTGEYAFRNKEARVLPGNAPLIIDPKRPTLPAFLQANGYATAVVGKWHLGLGSPDQPLDWNSRIAPGANEVGFGYSYIMAATADRVPSVYVENGLIVGLDAQDPVMVSYQKVIGKEPTGISHPSLLRVQADQQHSGTIVNGVSRIGWMTGGKQALFRDENMADTYLAKALAYIRQPKDRPYFLYYAPNEIHVPRVVHERFQGSSALGPRGDALAAFDWCVGRLVEVLKETGQYENTLIIVSSDNGPVNFDGYWDGAHEKRGTHRAAGPFRGGKYSRWEGGTRMPFIVSWPGQVKPGISDALVGQIDFYASLAALIGKPVPAHAGIDSQDVLSALLGRSPQGRTEMLEEALDQVAVRQGDWKYLPPGNITERGGIGEWRRTPVHEPGLLFNLAEDPGETRDLAATHPDKVRELREIISRIAPEKVVGAQAVNRKQLGF